MASSCSRVSLTETVARTATSMKLILTLSVFVAMAQGNEDLLDNLFQEGNDQFTAKMFSEVVKNNPDKSVVLSAFSVLTPLAQLSLASEGACQEELLKVIGLPDDNTTKAVFLHQNEKLRSIKGIELNTASKIYVTDKVELNPKFSAVTRDVFKSVVEKVDFMKSTETAKEINSWVQDQTNNRIENIISADDLDEDTRSILVNTIYFKGQWYFPFDNDTKEEEFYVSKDKTIKVPMMHSLIEESNYLDSIELNAQVLELRFTGFDASFIVILPNEIDGLDVLVEKLKDPSALKLATSQMSEYDVNVSLPKFKIETTTDLRNVLEKMDVKRVFDSEQARLTRLINSDEQIWVEKATQKTFIDVNEQGIEATAANLIQVVAMSLKPSAEFKANHPFVFFLKGGQYILFNGVFKPYQ